MTAVETVYGNLLNEFRRAHNAASVTLDTSLVNRIDTAIRVLEEIWPADCERYKARFAE